MGGHYNLQNWTFSCMEVELDWTLIGQQYKMSQKYMHTAYRCSHLYVYLESTLASMQTCTGQMTAHEGASHQIHFLVGITECLQWV